MQARRSSSLLPRRAPAPGAPSNIDVRVPRQRLESIFNAASERGAVTYAMTFNSEPNDVRFEDVNCTICISRPHPSIVLLIFEGSDTGAHGDGPFRELAKDIVPGQKIELFIDARGGRSASLDVSSNWARWLGKNRSGFRHVSMLTGSRFVQLSAGFVRKYADLGDVMRIYTEAAAFEGALASSVANARAM